MTKSMPLIGNNLSKIPRTELEAVDKAARKRIGLIKQKNFTQMKEQFIGMKSPSTNFSVSSTKELFDPEKMFNRNNSYIKATVDNPQNLIDTRQLELARIAVAHGPNMGPREQVAQKATVNAYSSSALQQIIGVGSTLLGAGNLYFMAGTMACEVARNKCGGSDSIYCKVAKKACTLGGVLDDSGWIKNVPPMLQTHRANTIPPQTNTRIISVGHPYANNPDIIPSRGLQASQSVVNIPYSQPDVNEIVNKEYFKN